VTALELDSSSSASVVGVDIDDVVDDVDDGVDVDVDVDIDADVDVGRL